MTSFAITNKNSILRSHYLAGATCAGVVDPGLTAAQCNAHQKNRCHELAAAGATFRFKWKGISAVHPGESVTLKIKVIQGRGQHCKFEHSLIVFQCFSHSGLSFRPCSSEPVCLLQLLWLNADEPGKGALRAIAGPCLSKAPAGTKAAIFISVITDISQTSLQLGAKLVVIYG